MILRPYQERAIKNCLDAIKKHKNTLLVSPTGAGKTIMLSAVAGHYVKKNKKVLVLAHRDELTSQNSEKFLRVNPDSNVSFFDASKKDWTGQAVFSMVQTLSQDKHLETMPPVDMVIIDESHRSAANSYRKVFEAAKRKNPNTDIFGVTATPERSDSRGLAETFNNVADVITLEELIRDGFLVPPRGMVIDLGTQEALSRVKKTANDYDQAEVEAIQNTTINNIMIVDKWKELASDRSTVVFCSTVQHAIDIRDAFRDAGVIAETLNGGTSKEERAAILKAFDRGDIQLVTNAMILTEGWDSQRCSCAVLLRTSSQKSMVIQMVGRALRTVDQAIHPGFIKKDALIMDFGISLLTHGDLAVNVKLKHDKGPKNEEKRKKKCPDCKAELPIQVKECPLCGYSFKIQVDEDGFYDELEELRLIEIDLVNKSPFRWYSLFESERAMLASGMSAWACVCSPDDENWYAVGHCDSKTTLLAISNKLNSISVADDFMRKNESASTSKKAASWRKLSATDKQRMNLAKLQVFANDSLNPLIDRGEAAAKLTFCFYRHKIEHLMGIR